MGLYYNEEEKRFSLSASGWIDRQNAVDEGIVHERRLVPPERETVATWKRRKKVDLGGLLEEAYDRATSYTEDEMTRVSSFIVGKDGVTREYRPNP